MDHQFGRAFKINQSSQYSSVFNNADFRVSSPNLTFIVKENKHSHARIGVVVAKKNIRRAVDRNLVKRIVKESFRKGEVSTLTVDIVVLVRGNLMRLNRKQQNEDLSFLWQSLIKKIRYRNPRN
jgi:ribonuclease P protein component